MATISLCMIVKSGRELFEECLSSMAPYVDEIVVVVDGESPDGCDEVAENFGAKIIRRELDGDFASQRNVSFEAATGDWILWLDSDDYLDDESASRIKILADEGWDKGIDAWFFDYQYAFDNYGRCTTVLRRERLLRRETGWNWKYEIHEVCLCDNPEPVCQYDPGVQIIHKRHETPPELRDPERNVRIIEKVLPNYEDDVRMIFYAGNEFLAAGQTDRAIECYETVVEKDSWAEQKFLSCYRLASLYIEQDELDKAKHWIAQGWHEDHRWAEGWCLRGDIALKEEEYDRALQCYKFARSIDTPTDLLLTFNPTFYTWYPLVKGARAAEGKGDYDLALELFDEAKKKYFQDDRNTDMQIARLGAMKNQHRRDGLDGIVIAPSPFSNTHPNIARMSSLLNGIVPRGTEVKLSEKPEDFAGSIATIFSGHKPVREDLIDELQQRGTDVVIDFNGPSEILESEGGKKMLTKASAVITGSPRLLEALLSLNEKSHYIPDTYIYSSSSTREERDDDVLRFLMISDLDEGLDRTRVFPVIHSLARKAGLRAEIVTLGDSDYADAELSGSMIDYYSKWADIGICYQKKDSEVIGAGIPLSMMALGIPVVATATPAVVDVIDHGRSGYACYGLDEWKVVLKELIENREARVEMGKNAALRARQFGPSSFVDKFLDVISLPSPTLDVIIPCHGEARYLKQCLDELHSSSLQTTRAIVVSNPVDEDDEIREAVLSYDGDLYIRQERVKTFAENCNTGIRASTAPFLCLLNSDTISTPGWDAELMRAMESGGKCVVACFSNGEKGWLHKEEMIAGGQELGTKHEIDEMSCTTRELSTFGKEWNEKYAGRVEERDWVTFPAVGIPAPVIRDIGLLNENLTNDREDLEFCNRLTRLGGKCLYAWGSFVFHYCGTTRDAVDGGQESDARKAMYAKNKWIMEEISKRSTKTIRFFMGSSWEAWLPEDIGRVGIGGSETCVVNVAKSFVKLGWNVEVYSTELSYPILRDGVAYYPHRDMDPLAYCDVLVISRVPPFFDIPSINAKVKILYNHDAHYGTEPEDPTYLTAVRVSAMDYVFVLTDWHKNQFSRLYPHIPEDKFYVTRNGIDPQRFERYRRGFIPKDAKRFVYSHSADRGLEVLLHMWPQIHAIDPEFRLHLYYGLNTWLRIAEKRNNEEEFERIKKIVQMQNQPGIISHGRVGQDRLATEMSMANLELYPTAFGETSCITAIEAMAGGMVMITSPIAALNETAKTADFIPGDNRTPTYQDAFIEQLQERLYEPNPKMQLGDREVGRREYGVIVSNTHYSWDTIAEEWDTLFIEHLGAQVPAPAPLGSKDKSTDVHFVVPYGASGGIKYPIDLAAQIPEIREDATTKVWMVRIGNEPDLTSAETPDEDLVEVLSVDEFRTRSEEVLDCRNIIAVNWEMFELIKSIGANEDRALRRMNLIQGDERNWAKPETISAMFSDPSWSFIYSSEYLSRTFKVPGEVVPNGIDLETFTPGDGEKEKLIGIFLHPSPLKNTDVVLNAIKDGEFGDYKFLAVTEND